MATKHHIVYLLPSAVTQWQTELRLQGDLDLPASDAGLQQVQHAAAAWMPAAGTGPRTIYSAPDEASRQTAHAFAAAVGAPGAPGSGVKIKSIDELREINLGLWQGLPYAEFKDRYPTAYGQWRQDPSKVVAPHGETIEQLTLRLKASMSRLIEKAGSDPVGFVLRPISLMLAMAWLSGQQATGPAANGQSLPLPEPRAFELDDATWRRIRYSRKLRSDGGDSRRISA